LNWPGYSGCYNREGFSCYTINSGGWRDIEHSLSKPKGTFRIAVLGDSYVEALQVDLEKTFWKRLEAMLNQQGKKVEVLGFGMSGFDAAQAFETLRHHAMLYDPDLIIFSFVSANDIRDSVRQISNIPYKPYYVLDGSNHLILDSSFVEYVENQDALWRQVYRWVRNSSRVLTAADLGLKGLVARFRRWRPKRAKDTILAQTKETRKPAEKFQAEPGLSGEALYEEPKPGSLYHLAWRINEQLILAMRDLAREGGAKFLVVGVTGGDALYQQTVRPTFNPFYPEQRMKALAEREDLFYLALADKVVEANQRGIHFHGFGSSRGSGHWNEDGHREAGKAIVSFLVSHQLIPLSRR
jgi:hypothetical protein